MLGCQQVLQLLSAFFHHLLTAAAGFGTVSFLGLIKGARCPSLLKPEGRLQQNNLEMLLSCWGMLMRESCAIEVLVITWVYH